MVQCYQNVDLGFLSLDDAAEIRGHAAHGACPL
jgi:hypothetical protein